MKRKISEFLKRFVDAESIKSDTAVLNKMNELITLIDSDSEVVAEKMKEDYIRQIYEGKVEVTSDMLAVSEEVVLKK